LEEAADAYWADDSIFDADDDNTGVYDDGDDDGDGDVAVDDAPEGNEDRFLDSMYEDRFDIGDMGD
jgi:hypothetical protein